MTGSASVTEKGPKFLCQLYLTLAIAERKSRDHRGSRTSQKRTMCSLFEESSVVQVLHSLFSRVNAWHIRRIHALKFSDVRPNVISAYLDSVAAQRSSRAIGKFS